MSGLLPVVAIFGSVGILTLLAIVLRAEDAPEPPRLIDWSGLTGENRLECTCGERIRPDCDVSAASIDAEWGRHLAAAHPGEA